MAVLIMDDRFDSEGVRGNIRAHSKQQRRALVLRGGSQLYGDLQRNSEGLVESKEQQKSNNNTSAHRSSNIAN